MQIIPKENKLKAVKDFRLAMGFTSCQDNDSKYAARQKHVQNDGVKV